jgi:dihydroorotate dehydrogenase electron transfer subunit
MSRGTTPVVGGVHRSTGPLQYRAEVLSTRRAGEYRVITLTAPGIPERARPGHFAAVAIGDERSGMLLRRAFSIYRVERKGAAGGVMELVVSAHGPGTVWLTERRRGDVVDVIAPLGKPFVLPKEPVATVLVGGGYGSAPLFWLAERLQDRGCRVDFVLGAATESKLFGVLEGRRIGSSMTVTTDDGSLGVTGKVTDVLGRLMDEHDTDVAYSCGPMPMLAAVTALAAQRGAHSQTAVEEAMACGIGVCMTCVLPVVGADGLTRMTRSCVAGPVFDGHSVRWNDVGTVPSDCVGAPTPVDPGPVPLRRPGSGGRGGGGR